jgi:hypothetical protein
MLLFSQFINKYGKDMYEKYLFKNYFWNKKKLLVRG